MLAFETPLDFLLIIVGINLVVSLVTMVWIVVGND